MFYYLNPGFRTILGHHHPHHLALYRCYETEFVVIANEKIEVNTLPYKVLRLFELDTWQYLEDSHGLNRFSQNLKNLKEYIIDGDVLFMYMSDILFLFPVLDFVIENKLRIKVILNLFHTGRYYFYSDRAIQLLQQLLVESLALRNACGISLMVEGVDIQREIEESTGELIPVIPMFHIDLANFEKEIVKKQEQKRKVITFLSATSERGFFQFIYLLHFIQANDPVLFERHVFRVRIHFDDPYYRDCISGLNPNVQIKFGRLTDEEYASYLLDSDIMLLPYLSEHYFGRTSGVLYETVAYNIPIVATMNTWNGLYVKKFGIGEVFEENSIQGFYEALVKTIENYAVYKNNFTQVPESWISSNNAGAFVNIEKSMPFGKSSELHNLRSDLISLNNIHNKIMNEQNLNWVTKNYSELRLITWFPFKGRKGNDKVLIDVGAHEGGVTSVFADKGWRVLAFEPEQNNRQVFLTRHESDKNVICVSKAVTDRTGESISFYTSDIHPGIHSIKPFHNTHHRATYSVQTITLKDALAENNIDHVSFLKVDTEGADYLALKGFDWDRIKPELVMVEFMDERSTKNFNYTHHDMAKFMKERGYVCYVSEWAPIKEYGIKGQIGEPHRWIQCVRYPLDHEPSWGNLIFVPEKAENKFKTALKAYMASPDKAKIEKRKKSLLLRTKMFIKKTFFK